MVGIEYSPNSRACCQGCRSVINKGDIRVSTKAATHRGRRDPFITKYHHAECYRGRKDFTLFYGFACLKKEDKIKFLSEKQYREMYPLDFELAQVNKEAENAKPSNKRKSEDDKIGKGGSKKAKAAETPRKLPITLTGLNHSECHASPGDKVVFVRDPQNTYDSNAIRVENLEGKKVGFVAKKEAASLSPIMDKLKRSSVEGTVTAAADGWKQTAEMMLPVGA